MITHISHTLAQQIVNTIKDVCSYDINFINPSGTIIASTNSARIGTYHEIGRKAAVTGTTIEVAESDNFTGTRQGINMPLYHEDCLLAVIGITGSPEKVRKYAFLAQRITSLLIREQELGQYSRHQADKKQFIIATEIETIHKLKNDNPDKEFIPVHPKTICGQMKKVTLESVQEALEKEQYVVEVAEDIRQRAWAPIERMLQIK